MSIKAISTPNIALIKYWGNRNEQWRLPVADSISMTLDTPSVEVTMEPADTFSVQSFDADGKENPQSEKSLARLQKHFDLTRAYLESIGMVDEMPEAISAVIRSAIPQAIGIASSAAVFSCLAEGYAGLLKQYDLTREQVSVIARLGSGSAARSVYGGYVAIKNKEGDGMGSAVAEQIADEKHWLLHDIIIVPSKEEKKVGSTEGHAMAATSPLFAERIKQMPRRMQECTDAILKRDFEKLRIVAEEDSLNMHEVMRTQTPSLQYLNDETFRIIKEIEALRKSDKLNVLYTMDAGPTVHLFCTEDSRKAVEEYAENQKGCSVFKAKVGQGSRLM